MRLLFVLLFPFFSFAQTFTKDRFIARNGQVIWTEKVEIKDMDTPIMIETLTEKLKTKPFIQLDSIQSQGVLTGSLFKPPLAPFSKAQFRIDFLYESYIVTASKIDFNKQKAETTLLKKNGSFVEKLPTCAETFDKAMISLFAIKF